MDLNSASKYRLVAGISKSIQSDELLNDITRSISYETKINVLDSYFSGDEVFIMFDKEISKHNMVILIDNKKIRLNFKRPVVHLSNKMDYFFPFISKTVRDQLQADETALFSITTQFLADNISLLLQQLINKPDVVITDACACVGGNTYSFSRFFKKVNAVEYDSTRYEYLVKNLELLNVKNTSTYQGDYLKIMDEVKQNVIFFDPPWGGPDYKDEKDLHLYLGNTDIIDLVSKLLTSKVVDLIALKVPQNFDFDDCVKKLGEFNMIQFDMNKFVLLIIEPGDKVIFMKHLKKVYQKNYLYGIMKQKIIYLDNSRWRRLTV